MEKTECAISAQAGLLGLQVARQNNGKSSGRGWGLRMCGQNVCGAACEHHMVGYDGAEGIGSQGDSSEARLWNRRDVDV